MHIAVILPERYRGGTLRGAMNITRMLALGAKASGEALTLSFGHVDDQDLYSPSDFTELRELGVTVRPFHIQFLRGSEINPLYESWFDDLNVKPADEYIAFNDGVSNFEDADFWVVVSDRLRACIPPHRPYAVVVYDYIQRYVPKIFGAGQVGETNWKNFEQFAEVTRRANFVMCTTEQTRRDCIAFAGARPERVAVFPMEFDPIDGFTQQPTAEAAAPYLLWTTNSTEHKNHLVVIEGLERFFRQHPESPMQIWMSGVYTQLFGQAGRGDPHFDLPWPKKVRAALAAAPEVSRRLKICGNMEEAEYIAALRGASWVLHGALYDNGTFSLVEGAWMGVPAISSRYPAIVEQCEMFGLDVVLFDPHDPSTLASALAENLPRHSEWVRRLPARDALAQRSFRLIAPQYWGKFREMQGSFHGR
jgi:glycosyltransferase involved in cell wall biosynthesis